VRTDILLGQLLLFRDGGEFVRRETPGPNHFWGHCSFRSP